ncbi:hypothetical protein RBH26_03110 [Natronolimnohabitans sp. A-GB9]|nr:hypothetical protein [Natronolimnohabitans sp. A-GB9]MDQ2049466.1 hypothetical protein [Natronolimnohabitans sp. A-GB9]
MTMYIDIRSLPPFILALVVVALGVLGYFELVSALLEYFDYSLHP